jgi:hypothetical protein
MGITFCFTNRNFVISNRGIIGPILYMHDFLLAILLIYSLNVSIFNKRQMKS